MTSSSQIQIEAFGKKEMEIQTTNGVLIHCKYDELVPVGALRPYPKNRNQHSKEQIERLAKLIKYQGMRAPIVIDADDGMTILKGHGTLSACKELGMETVPVVKQSFEDEDQKYAYCQSDNAIASWSDLDLKGINSDLSDLGPFDIDLLGIKDFTVEPADKYGDKDADDVPEQRSTSIVSGDLYALGVHRLLCGDSTEKVQVEILMNGEKADMVFTDPPYNVAEDSENYAANTSKSLKNLKNSAWDYGFKPVEFLSLLPSVIAENCFVYVFTSHRLFGEIVDWMESQFSKSSFLVWCKPNPMPSLSKTTWTFGTELIPYCRVGKPKFNYPDGEHCLNWINQTKKSDGSHPTQKPIELIEKITSLSSIPGHLILDPFLGSGSTLIACEKTNRKCYGMEIDPVYCQVIIDRFEQFTGQKAVKL